MDQVKIGTFLRELRKEKNLTQEQIAEQFGVAARTVSRWENGNNMPDLSILVELADYYDVDIRELIDGERKSENMTEEMKDTLERVADYSDEEKEIILKGLYANIIASVILFIVLSMIPFAVAILPEDDIFLRYSHLRQSTYLVAIIGIVVSGTGLKRILQYIGNMNKERVKKIRKVVITISILVMILCVAVVLALITTMFQ